MRHQVVTLLFAALVVCPALAEGGKPAKPAEPGTSVEMPFLIAPMSKDGKLLGYAYISHKVVCSSGSATVAVREKLAFIQDADVRDVNARPVGRSDDPMKVDDAALGLRLMENARSVVGANKIVGVVFMQIQFAPLHPSQSTLNMVSSEEKADALTRAAAASDATASRAPAPPPATSAKPAATSTPPSANAR